MASLYQQLINRVNDLAVWVGDTIQLRGFKTGGTVGQVPVKSGPGDFAWAWGDMTGGGGGTPLTSYTTQVATLLDYPTILTTPQVAGTASIRALGTGATDATAGNDSRLSDARPPTAHTHGNLTNDGKIGTTAGLPIITSTAGLLVTGTFGTTAGTFCAGDDSRVVGAMASTGGTMTNGTIGGTLTINSTSITFGTGAAAALRTAASVPASIANGTTGEDAITNIVSLTAAEFAALGSKNASTLYIVT